MKTKSTFVTLRDVWLVKVPKYISSRLGKALPMNEIGKIKIIENSGEEPQILFNMSKELSEILDSVNDSRTSILPLERRFSISC